MKIYTATIYSYNKNDIHGRDRPHLIIELDNKEMIAFPERTVHNNPEDKNFNPKHAKRDNSKFEYFRFSPENNGISHYIVLADLKFITEKEIFRIYLNSKFKLQNAEFINNFFATENEYLSIKNKILFSAQNTPNMKKIRKFLNTMEKEYYEEKAKFNNSTISEEKIEITKTTETIENSNENIKIETITETINISINPSLKEKLDLQHQKKQQENKFWLEQSEKNQKKSLDIYSLKILEIIEKHSENFIESQILDILNGPSKKAMDFIKQQNFIEFNDKKKIKLTSSGEEYLNKMREKIIEKSEKESDSDVIK